MLERQPFSEKVILKIVSKLLPAICDHTWFTILCSLFPATDLVTGLEFGVSIVGISHFLPAVVSNLRLGGIKRVERVDI